MWLFRYQTVGPFVCVTFDSERIILYVFDVVVIADTAGSASCVVCSLAANIADLIYTGLLSVNMWLFRYQTVGPFVCVTFDSERIICI